MTMNPHIIKTSMRTISALFLLGVLASQAQGHDLLMFGDSITQGLQRNSSYIHYGVQSPPNGSRVNGSYGPELESLLAEQETSWAFNWGYSGEETPEGVNRIATVLASRTADYILILEGANDLINGVSQASSVTNLGYMIDKAVAAGTEPIISELTPMSCPKYCNWDKYVESINEEIVNLAAEKNVVLSELHEDMDAAWSSTYTSGDGLHVSDSGYALMAQKWYDAIMTAEKEETSSGSQMAGIYLLLLKK